MGIPAQERRTRVEARKRKKKRKLNGDKEENIGRLGDGSRGRKMEVIVSRDTVGVARVTAIQLAIYI